MRKLDIVVVVVAFVGLSASGWLVQAAPPIQVNCKNDASALSNLLTSGQVVDGHCTNPCIDANQCLPVPGCSATPACAMLAGGERVCILECSDGTCPIGMECISAGSGVEYCM